MTPLDRPESSTPIVGPKHVNHHSGIGQEDVSEYFAYQEAALHFTDAERYLRGTRDLHVHGIFGDAFNFCAVTKALTLAD